MRRERTGVGIEAYWVMLGEGRSCAEIQYFLPVLSVSLWVSADSDPSRPIGDYGVVK